MPSRRNPGTVRQQTVEELPHSQLGGNAQLPQLSESQLKVVAQHLGLICGSETKERALATSTIGTGTGTGRAIRRTELPCGCKTLSNELVLHAPATTLTRYMRQQMMLGGQMNALYGINFYPDDKLQHLCRTLDVESELIQLRQLLMPQHLQQRNKQQQQQLLAQLNDHMYRLMQLNMQQLAKAFEESFLCGMLDVAQLQQVQQLLPLQQLSQVQRQPLTCFYRRLSAELPNFRYNMCLPQHFEYLQHYLMLHELNPKPQARRLLNATIAYMSQLQLPQLQQFLNILNPAQLQRLILHLSCSYIQLPSQQQQHLHQTALRVLQEKPTLQLLQWHSRMLHQLLSRPVDEPMTVQQRRFLQCLLDHLLPVSKSLQLQFLRNLNYNISKWRQFRLLLHNPALLCDPLQMKQLYSNLKQLTKVPSQFE